MAMACYYSLETLDLSGCMHIGPQLGEALSALPNLKGLSLARVKGVNNEQIIMVTETIPGLTSLDVSDCFKIKEQGIKAMAGLKELEHVNITCIPVMESSIRTVLSECTKLREVILAGTKCSNSCSHELKNLENLVKLDMRDTSIGDEALMELSPQVLQQMLELYVGSTFISDKALTFVAKAAQSMVKLSLAETNVTNAAIRSLESLRLTLKELDLSNCKKLTLEGGEIRGLQVLEVLNVADSAVGDDAVRFITQMDSLKELNVSGTDITDVSIDLVCESKAIHELNTNGCYHITPKAMAKWEKFSILRADDNPLDEKEDDETEENPMLPGVDRAADN